MVFFVELDFTCETSRKALMQILRGLLMDLKI